MKKITTKNYIGIERKTFTDDKGKSVEYDSFTLNIYVDAKKEYTPLKISLKDRAVYDTLASLGLITTEEISEVK